MLRDELRSPVGIARQDAFGLVDHQPTIGSSGNVIGVLLRAQPPIALVRGPLNHDLDCIGQRHSVTVIVCEVTHQTAHPLLPQFTVWLNVLP